jgi:acetyl-CoA carboxylase carboxyl transferase subunit beta
LDHGMLDRVTKRTDLKDELVTIVRLLMKQDAPVKGDLPAPEIQSNAAGKIAAAEAAK